MAVISHAVFCLIESSLNFLSNKKTRYAGMMPSSRSNSNVNFIVTKLTPIEEICYNIDKNITCFCMHNR